MKQSVNRKLYDNIAKTKVKKLKQRPLGKPLDRSKLPKIHYKKSDKDVVKMLPIPNLLNP